MTAPHDADRLIRAYLDAGPTELPDRSFDAVRDTIERTGQRTAFGPWRKPDMTGLARFAIAAAAVVIAASVLSISLLPGLGGLGGPGATPSPSPTTSPALTPSPTAPTASPVAEQLSTLIVDEPFPVRITFDVGTGWILWGDVGAAGKGWYKHAADPPIGIGMTFWIVTNVLDDPCDGEPLDPPLGPSVDDLADALAAQPHTVVAQDTAVTIDGYSGRYLEYTANDMSDCPYGRLRRWMTAGPTREALAGEHDQVWILDVDGTRVVIDAFSFAGSTAEDLAALDAIAETIRIGPD
jgi:hypothetical protein